MDIPAPAPLIAQKPEAAETVQRTRHRPAENSANKKLMDRCQEFEAVLYYSMLQTMRSTIEQSGLIHGGNAEEIYTSMIDQEYAKAMSMSTRSRVAVAMYEQLQRRGRALKAPLAPLQQADVKHPLKQEGGVEHYHKPFN